MSSVLQSGAIRRRAQILGVKARSPIGTAGIIQYSTKTKWNFWGQPTKNFQGVKMVLQNKLNDFPDAFTPRIVADFGYDLFPLNGQLKMDHVLDPDAQGGAHTGTKWGSFGVSLSPDTPYTSYGGVTGFWYYIFSLHETINVWTGALAKSWVWADGSPLWGGSSPFPNMCVKPDTILLGDNLEISKLVPQNSVIGQTGLNSVLQAFRRSYDGSMVQLKAVGMFPIEITPEHPVLIAEGKRTKLVWKPAKMVSVDDYLVMPRLKGFLKYSAVSGLPLTEDTAWLLGIYAAEGYPNTQGNAALFCLHVNEKKLQCRIIEIAEKLGYPASDYQRAHDKSTVVAIRSRFLADALVQLCGKGALNKKIPDAIMLHRNSRLCRAFLDGYLDGDGHETVYGSNAVTISKILAMQLQLLCARLGFILTINKARSAGVGNIQGRTVNLHEKYNLYVTMIPFRRYQRMYLRSDVIYSPVIETNLLHYQGDVCNIATTDNSYLVSNAIVHNCDIVITNEVGLATISQLQATRMAGDARVTLLLSLQQKYGWKIYQVLFSLTKQYGITDWGVYAEPLRTAITVLFLSAGAFQSSGNHTNLLSAFQGAGVNVPNSAYTQAQQLFPNVKT